MGCDLEPRRMLRRTKEENRLKRLNFKVGLLMSPGSIRASFPEEGFDGARRRKPIHMERTARRLLLVSESEEKRLRL